MSINPTKVILGILTPLVTAASGWLVAAAGKYGIHLDATGVNLLGTAGATAGAAAMVKLIHDVEANKSVEKVIHTIEGDAAPVVKAVETVDPNAKAQADSILAQVEKVVEAKFNSLVSSLPKPPPAAAPAVANVPPAPTTPPSTPSATPPSA